jgi:hypothetical protein
VVDGYHDALLNVRKSPVIGPFIKGHERGLSRAKVEYMEEGKTRVE